MVLPPLIWNEEPTISDTSEDAPSTIDGVPQLFVVDKIESQILEGPMILDAPSLKWTSKVSGIVIEHTETYTDAIAETPSFQMNVNRILTLQEEDTVLAY